MKHIYSLAFSFLYGSKEESSMGVMTKITFASIFIGSVALGLTMAIMRGFEIEIYNKIKGVHADATMYMKDEPLNYEVLNQLFQDEFPIIQASSPQSSGYGIVPINNKEPLVVQIKGIDPDKEMKVSTLHRTIATPHVPFHVLLKNNQVVIGRQFARQARLHVGDTFDLYFLDDLQTKRKKLSLDSTILKVGGIFSTGIEEFDTQLIYCSQETFAQLFDYGVTHISLSLIKHNLAQLRELEKRTGLPVYSWRELYPALVSALELEKYVMFFILLLIAIVASMSLCSLMFMLITYKRREIAILRALGCPYKQIMAIFSFAGIALAASATGFGCITAVLISYVLKYYIRIPLPESYLVEYLPITLDLWNIVLVFCASIILTAIALIIPLRAIRIQQCATILRFEG